MKHTFALNIKDPRTFNIGSYNPTCRAIIKAMHRMNRPATGDEILRFAVENSIWQTRQDPSKYHTTWSYYWHKKFKYESTIVKVGEVSDADEVEMLEPGSEGVGSEE